MITASALVLRNSRQLAVVGALLFSILVCCGLLGLRMTYAHNTQYYWLLWNLFLACVPAGAALIAYNVQKHRSRLNVMVVLLCFAGWFLFFPNAPYLATDLIHLQAKPDAPFWFDLLLLLAFAWTGFFLGLVSLLLMQEVVRIKMGPYVSWLFALTMVALASFGIYLGRFLRWNSWDVLYNPFNMLGQVARQFRHPFMHAQAMVFSMLFGFFMLAMYLTLTAITNFRHEGRS